MRYVAHSQTSAMPRSLRVFSLTKIKLQKLYLFSKKGPQKMSIITDLSLFSQYSAKLWKTDVIIVIAIIVIVYYY